MQKYFLALCLSIISSISLKSGCMVGSPHPISVTSSMVSIIGSKERNISISNDVSLKSAAFLPHIIQFRLQALVSSKTSLLGYDSSIVLFSLISFKFNSVFFFCFSVRGFPSKSIFVFALITIPQSPFNKFLLPFNPRGFIFINQAVQYILIPQCIHTLPKAVMLISGKLTVNRHAFQRFFLKNKIRIVV